MKFVIITKYGQIIVEAEGFDEAAQEAYDDHTGYDNVQAIVKLEEWEEE